MSDEIKLHKTIILNIHWSDRHVEAEKVDVFPGETVSEFFARLDLRDFNIKGKKYYLTPDEILFDIVTDSQELQVFGPLQA